VPGHLGHGHVGLLSAERADCGHGTADAVPDLLPGADGERLGQDVPGRAVVGGRGDDAPILVALAVSLVQDRVCLDHSEQHAEVPAHAYRGRRRGGRQVLGVRDVHPVLAMMLS
jgi:hypothetical protein